MIYINKTPLENITDLQITEEVGGDFSLSLTSFSVNNRAHDFIEEEAVITADGHDFRVKQITETKYAKHIVATHIFFDLNGIQRYEKTKGGNRFSDYLQHILSGTGWTFIVSDDKTMTLPKFGKGNALYLINALCGAYNYEYQILPNKRLRFGKKIGPDNGVQYRYGYNVKTIERQIDTTELRTRITGHGKGIALVYTSPHVDQFGIIEADPFEDERYTTHEDLRTRLKEELNDVPSLAITLDAVELTSREIGESIWLIYEPLNIKLKTRILRKTSAMKGNRIITESVVIGNSLPKTSVDWLADEISDTKDEIEKQEDLTDDKISDTKKEFEVRVDILDDRIETEVKRIDNELLEQSSKITQTATEIRAEVREVDKRLDGKIESNSSLISQTAREIRMEVNQEINRVDGDIERNNSLILQTATEIRTEIKHEKNRVDEEFEGVLSSISKVDQKADSITSTVGTIEVEMTDLGKEVKTHSSEIKQMSNEISLKVSAGDIASEINQTAQGVKIRADKIQMDGIVELSDSVELGMSSGSSSKAIKFNGTSAWIYSDGSNLNISSNYLNIQAYTEALSPISNRRGGLVLAPNGLWMGIQSDGSLRVSDGSRVQYYAPM